MLAVIFWYFEGACFSTHFLDLNNVFSHRIVLTACLCLHETARFMTFKRTVSWKKYRFERKAQPKNNNLDYMIDPSFRDINRLFVLSFKSCAIDPNRNSFDIIICH